jgi:hypothetical protein
MKLEREVIVDLLPAYFSGEASAATRALVEEYFREHPEFEQSARNAGSWLERLNVPTAAVDPEKEKMALERARGITETRTSFLWMAIVSTLILFLFRIQNGKVIWILWAKPMAGILFACTAAFLWLFYFYTLRKNEPLPAHVKFLWMAIFYTVLLFLFKIENHKIVWLMFNHDSAGGPIMAFFTAGLWACFFYQRWQRKRQDR